MDYRAKFCDDTGYCLKIKSNIKLVSQITNLGHVLNYKFSISSPYFHNASASWTMPERSNQNRNHQCCNNMVNAINNKPLVWMSHNRNFSHRNWKVYQTNWPRIAFRISQQSLTAQRGLTSISNNVKPIITVFANCEWYRHLRIYHIFRAK